jgi:hypothetical protein
VVRAAALFVLTAGAVLGIFAILKVTGVASQHWPIGIVAAITVAVIVTVLGSPRFR